jgi:hypothetical protein
VHPPTVWALCVWDSPPEHMLFDSCTTAVNEESQTASFDYLPPHAHDNFDGDTRPWAELRPKDGANAGRSMRQRTSRYDNRLIAHTRFVCRRHFNCRLTHFCVFSNLCNARKYRKSVQLYRYIS